MPANPETLRQQKDRIADMASTAYRVTWKNFPDDLRPEKGLLPNSKNIIIGKISDNDETVVHPDLRNELKGPTEVMKMVLDQLNDASNFSWHDGKHYIFIPELIDMGEPVIKQAVYHDVGVNVSMGTKPILPAEYDQVTREAVEMVLTEAFEPGVRPGIERTQIDRYGFRKLLKADGFAVKDLFTSRYIFTLNELFNLGFEFTTSEIMKSGGNIRNFDEKIKSGLIAPGEFISHPQYFNLFFSLAQEIDWRIILAAFKKGDLFETSEMLRPFLGTDTRDTLNKMIDAIRTDDDQETADTNNFLESLGI